MQGWNLKTHSYFFFVNFCADYFWRDFFWRVLFLVSTIFSVYYFWRVLLLAELHNPPIIVHAKYNTNKVVSNEKVNNYTDK